MPTLNLSGLLKLISPMPHRPQLQCLLDFVAGFGIKVDPLLMKNPRNKSLACSVS